MAKKRSETNIQRVTPGFLADYTGDTSLDTLRQHVEVPRVKIIQNMSATGLKEAFGEGSAVVRPGDVLVCNKDDSITFVPLFFFIEWAKWADMKSSAAYPILERSFDPTSHLAVKAKDPDKRLELYDGHASLPQDQQCHYRYVEHLRFISVIYGDHELRGTPLTISFERGEYSNGKGFIAAISMRREVIDGEPKAVPLWAQVWSARPAYRDKGPQRKWWGFDLAPAEPSIINEEDAASFREKYMSFKKSFEDRLIAVQEVDNMEPEATPSDDM